MNVRMHSPDFQPLSQRVSPRRPIPTREHEARLPIANQAAAIALYASARKHREIVRSFIDDGISGTSIGAVSDCWNC